MHEKKMFRCFRCADTAQTRRETPKLRCGAEGGGGGGGLEETRSGTKIRCFHNLQSGHLAGLSADNCCIFPVVNILEARSDNTLTMPLCFFRISYI